LPLREQQPKGPKGKAADLKFEISFFEGIARRDPKNIDALQILGDAYTKAGHWETGLRIDQRLAKLCADNPIVFYNLACSYALLKQINRAFAALRNAITLGYKDVRWLKKDPDLANLRDDPRFTALCKLLAKPRRK